MAHYLLRVQSIGSSPLRIGQAGPILSPRGQLLLDRSLPVGKDVDTILVYRMSGRLHAELRIAVKTLPVDPEEERAVPLPDIEGYPLRITAGFHARNHREPGHRRALDIVPVLPAGKTIFGREVRSPFKAWVLALTKDQPDRPGHAPNEVLLKDETGRVWRFAHFMKGSSPLLPGQRLDKGALLGRIGLSGKTSGPHLHMELVLQR